MNDRSAKKFRVTVISKTTPKPSDATPGHRKLRFKLSTDVRRQANSGPTPVRKSRNSAIGTFTRLKKGGPTLIFSPVTASLITGNNVPHKTAKHAPSSTRLLNRKLDSRETTDSSCCSLFR